MTPPHTPTRPIACRLDIRLPGRPDTACSLFARDPLASVIGTRLGDLPLADFMTRQRMHPGSLLVGTLPYPGEKKTPGPGSSPASLHLFADCGPPPMPATGSFRLTRRFRPDSPADGYLEGVRRIQAYLAAGDAYQVNLAQRFTAEVTGDPYEAYVALLQRFAPPYSAYLDLGDCRILSLSPESFVEVTGNTVVTRPIKGTRPRGKDPASDRALADDLHRHPKDRAENLMIVDLLRNDLGKVCIPGSVRTPSLFDVISLPNVHHLVSTVSGTMAAEQDIGHLLQAVFPGGSITGAPKRRAMEIIAELEPFERDIYCGSIFWVLPDGTFGSNIAIRTFTVREGLMHGWAGAGIVADSDPATEQAECLHKLQPLMSALELLG